VHKINMIPFEAEVTPKSTLSQLNWNRMTWLYRNVT